MRILIVTAVPAERDALLRGDAAFPGNTEVDVLAAGVGPAAAAAGTAVALARSPYDLVVSAGIAGGFAPVAPVGSVVVADRVVAADLGAESDDGFVPIDDLGFGTGVYDLAPELVAPAAQAVREKLGAVSVGPILTVSTVTGSAARAAELMRRHPGAAAEAMEGFGVATAAAGAGVPFLELRSVSNPVGPRDRAAWRIGEALAALGAAAAAVLPVLAALPVLPAAPVPPVSPVRKEQS
ncbi:futalosine hydrolase [Yinghuangia soli]|uniref:Futalosine hydrolase n=1 Tax=Yinghuangia soli TaxID=2908204 RepID=A0AA41Q0Q7_9ACTN|nr:futalosine hydrolase [Yinghuangia soli]MCF2529429.1 futalosine hydrolase [Yinghuangia soli]